MKKECEKTRSLLPRYLRGHLFKPQQKRIERHLASCAVCRSEFDALRQIGETRRILKDMMPPETVAGIMKEQVSALHALKKLAYRPLWLIMIAAVIAVSYFYVIDPILHDPDIEKLDAGTPPPPAATVPPAPQQKIKPAPAAAAPRTDPLVVTITLEKQNEQESIRTINEAMKEHPLLKNMHFSDKVREISGSLSSNELVTFLNRIQSAGKITYRRSRLASAGGELLPFVVKLKSPPAPAQASTGRPADDAGAGPEAKPEDIPVERPVSKPEDRPAPPPPSPPEQ
jgi:hypothetical protein